jgi:hypothetical protein
MKVLTTAWIDFAPSPSKSWNKVKNKKHPALLRVKEAFELERQHIRKQRFSSNRGGAREIICGIGHHTYAV